MELELFDFIEQVAKVYEGRVPEYVYAETKLKRFYEQIAMENDNSAVSVYTRVKTRESLKEKLLRNKFYLHFNDPKDALEHLSDVVGITIECRFIRNEAEIYRSLFRHFRSTQTAYSQCVDNENVYLNLRMVQPQVQRNGFTIYRIDGYYIQNNKRINYELQIKALVHRFWSEIEHEVVYKNPEFVVYDRFIKNMLGSVRDNLDVVDRQLEIIYNEISNESSRIQIGMDDSSFKVLCASSINDLVNVKMKESVGFRSDFKKCSAILAQYIYIRYFINGEHNKEHMIDFLEHLNFLAQNPLDFRSALELESPFVASDPFQRILGEFWISMMNEDFEWHIFFVMLFAIQPETNIEDFTDFVRIIKTLLIQPSWYAERFSKFDQEQQSMALGFFEQTLAKAYAEAKVVETIHEDKLLQSAYTFREFIEKTEADYPDRKSVV